MDEVIGKLTIEEYSLVDDTVMVTIRDRSGPITSTVVAAREHLTKLEDMAVRFALSEGWEPGGMSSLYWYHDSGSGLWTRTIRKKHAEVTRVNGYDIKLIKSVAKRRLFLGQRADGAEKYIVAVLPLESVDPRPTDWSLDRHVDDPALAALWFHQKYWELKQIEATYASE
ncbi:hypothetical protein AB0B15_02925 [Streptomyces sp. NPDC045456]|uniref:hypothetical protein n=1 Tax=Streptomyces sp. NPDC045456 TaxID=3155254 RepID=UPI0033E11717